MKLLVTGSSSGIGRGVALYFLNKGIDVIGLDINESTISNPHYQHFICDVANAETLPEIKDIEIVFSNAGVQNSGKDIDVNLKGAMNITKKYVLNNKSLKSVLYNASSSASTGFEFDEYVASKAGLVGYMKHVAALVAPIGETCNSISLGGVITDLNKPVMEDKGLWNKIMEVTPLKKWMSVEEVSQWVCFLTLINKSMSGQDILIDNGEKDLNNTFVWPNK